MGEEEGEGKEKMRKGGEESRGEKKRSGEEEIDVETSGEMECEMKEKEGGG